MVHLIIDDAAALVDRSAAAGIWQLENRQERARWDKFMAWNAFHGLLGEEDLVGAFVWCFLGGGVRVVYRTD